HAGADEDRQQRPGPMAAEAELAPGGRAHVVLDRDRHAELRAQRGRQRDVAPAEVGRRDHGTALGVDLPRARDADRGQRVERGGEVRQAIRAEEDQHDDEDDDEFLGAKAKHVMLLFSVAPSPYPLAQAPRKTLRSPTRAVTRRASKNSSSGMAYLREMPSRSLMSPGPISLRSRSMATTFSWIESRACAWK